jgi:hypothetical protein
MESAFDAALQPANVNKAMIKGSIVLVAIEFMTGAAFLVHWSAADAASYSR